jgi:hypothetical protein
MTDPLADSHLHETPAPDAPTPKRRPMVDGEHLDIAGRASSPAPTSTGTPDWVRGCEAHALQPGRQQAAHCLSMWAGMDGLGGADAGGTARTQRPMLPKCRQ